MMRMLKFGTVAAAAAMMAAAAQAETTYSLQLPILSYASESATDEPDGGEEVKSKTSSTTTADQAGAYLAVNLDKISVYVYPLADLKVVSLSYWVMEPVEIGLNIGINSTKVDKPKDESASNSFGLFAGYTLPITPDQLTAEFYLVADNATEKSTKETEAGDEKINLTKSSLRLSADFVCNINKQVAYVGGFNYTTTNTENKESKEKTKAGTFGLNLATLRLSF